MNKPFNLLLTLALTLSNVAIAAETDFTELDSATPPLARLTNIGTDAGLIFEVRAKDLEAAKSKAKVDPIILGRVRGIQKIANFSSDFNKPTFSIATFKVVGNTEEWVATTSHRYHLRKGSARFRLPLVGLSDPNSKYRFYILTDTGATYAGPFEGTFSPADDALVTSETDSNSFPAALPSGFTKTQLDGIAKYILQRLVILPQSSHRDITSAVQITEGSNNFVLTLPTASTPVNTFSKKVKLANTDNGTSGGSSANIVARGNFSPLASYSTGDIVSSDSSSFIASKSITAGSTAPTRANINDAAVAANWTLLVAGPATPTSTTIVNNTTTVTPQGNYSTTVAYKKGDTVMFGGSTFIAQQDIPAGSVLPTPSSNAAWALLSVGTPITIEEDVILPGSGIIQIATLNATNPGGGSNSPATVITLKSSTNNVPVSLNLTFAAGNLTPISYEYQGVTKIFGASGNPVAPISNGTALTISGQDYSIFFSANKINLKNQPLLGSFTAKTINVKYKAF